jgi:hypothetical protein
MARRQGCGECAVPSEADKYWHYSRECTKQALQAETPHRRDQFLELARVWTDAARREEMYDKNSKSAEHVTRDSTGHGTMGQILKFIPPDTVFDADTAAMLGAVFDRTMVALHGDGQPEIVRETIAKRIIAMAAKGERDPDRLCESALAALGRVL